MRRALLAVLLVLVTPAGAAAAPQLQPVGTFDAPVHVAGPPGDPARLFVVEKPGRVQLLVDGQRQPAPFLDLTAIVDEPGERGMLSIAFPPDYATSGLFYVFLTATAAFSPSGEAGDLVVLEGRRSATNPNVADAHRRRVFSIPHPGATNHNGGQLAFGHDGLLYVSTGDGAVRAADAQDDASLLGKILRVYPRTGSAPQIWAKGLRNPWRFSFDRATGDMLIGDVGNSAREEVDFGPAGVGGRNYGWPACEGSPPGGCALAGAILPALSLEHGDGYTGVIGGVVVRDPGLPTLLGRYLFGDLNKGTLLSAVVGAAGGGDLREEALPVATPYGFGEDGCGHVHVALAGGAVHRIQDGAPGACVVPPAPAPAPAPPGTPPPSGTDTTAPALRAKAARRLRRGRLRVVLRAGEASVATLRAKGFRRKRVTLAAEARRVVRLRATKRGARRLRRALRDDRRPRVTVRIRCRDAAGNVRVRRVQVRLRAR